MADAAEGPDVDVMDWGRVTEIPAVGSALEGGHKDLAGRFLEASPFVWTAEAEEPVEALVAVDEVDDWDDRDEDEFDLVAVFLGGMSILETSSALMAKPLEVALLEAPHADLGIFWKLGGGATAVM
jgi:hypothetical protein